jgi:hypothetical protein
MLDVIARLDGHTARMPSLYHYGDGGGKKSRAELDSYPLRPQYQNKPKFMIQILIKFCHLRDSATGHLVLVILQVPELLWLVLVLKFMSMLI